MLGKWHLREAVQKMLRQIGSLVLGVVVAAWAGSAGAALMSFDTSQSQFTPGINNQGAWANRVLPCCINSDSNDNYFTGEADFGLSTGFAELRSFFSFDLSGLSGQVDAARLIIYSGVFGPDSFSEVLGLFDVTTQTETLNFNEGLNAAIFSDLGTGASYGTFRLLRSSDEKVDLEFDLSAVAIADINAAAGGFFSIGGALQSLSKAGGEYVFGQTGGPQRRPVELIVSTIAVPAPGAFSLCVLALIVLARLHRKEARVTAFIN